MNPNEIPAFAFWSMGATVGILVAVGLDVLVRKNARARWAFRWLKKAMEGTW